MGDKTSSKNIFQSLSIKDLETLFDAFQKKSDGTTAGLLDINEFREITTRLGLQGDVSDILFKRIDMDCEGRIDWDLLSAFMLLEFQDASDTSSGQSSLIGQKPTVYHAVHGQPIVRICGASRPSRYCSVSQDGGIRFWDSGPAIQRSLHIPTDSNEINTRDLWITDATVWWPMNRIVLASTSKELLFYDFGSKSDFVLTHRLLGFESVPFCVSSLVSERSPNAYRVDLAVGDTSGVVHVLHFSTIIGAIFEASSQVRVTNSGSRTKSIPLSDVVAGLYLNVVYYQHHKHTDWVRQVTYIPSLDCFVSCSTSGDHSMVLAWTEKTAAQLRTSSFAVQQGIYVLDYDERHSLIATGGASGRIYLWNPYVNTKPVGKLLGHAHSVVALQFAHSRCQLYSFSKDRVLRVWDASNHICIQRLAGIFPAGPLIHVVMHVDNHQPVLMASFGQTMCVLSSRLDASSVTTTHENPIVTVLVSQRLLQVVTVCCTSFAFWAMQTGQKLRFLTGPHGMEDVTFACLDRAAVKLFTCASGKEIKVWDFNCNSLNVISLDNPSLLSPIFMCFSTRAAYVFGFHKHVHYFTSRQMKHTRCELVIWKGKPCHSQPIKFAAVVSSDQLATLDRSGLFILWNIITESPIMKTDLHKPISLASPASLLRKAELPIDSISIVVHSTDSSDKTFFIVALTYGRLLRLDTSSNSISNTSHLSSSSSFTKLVVDGSGDLVVTGDSGGTLRLYDVSVWLHSNESSCVNYSPTWERRCHDRPVTALAFCDVNDNRFVLSGSSDCRVCLTDIANRISILVGQNEVWLARHVSEKLTREPVTVAGPIATDETSEDTGSVLQLEKRLDEDFVPGQLLGGDFRQDRLARKHVPKESVGTNKEWLSVGQMVYESLLCSELSEIVQLQRPDILVSPEKCFETATSVPSAQPQSSLNLSVDIGVHQLASKNLFGKEALDIEAKLKVSTVILSSAPSNNRTNVRLA